MIEPDAVFHERSGQDTRWSTVNMAEVLPGVLTPLAWSFWRDPCEAGLRAAFADVGVLPRAEMVPPASIDQRLTGLFFGRYAGNLTFICSLCDRTPGSSGEAFEEQMFGFADPDVERHRSYRRYPVVAAQMPVNVALLRRRLRALRAEVDRWWRVRSLPGTAQVRLAEARDLLRRAMRTHMLASLVAQGCYDQVAALAKTAGKPGLELELMTGYGGMEELRVTSDLWEVSRDRLTMDEFLSRHGYHGPSEGELSSRSWREDRRVVEANCQAYRRMGESEQPADRERRRAAIRRAAEASLYPALPRAGRLGARVALKAAATFLPLREVGKSAFLQAVDGGRAAVRLIGDDLVARDVIDARDDVFYLVLDEVTGIPPADARERVAQRRAQRTELLGLQIPERWTGNPDSAVRDLPGSKRGAVVKGVPVSGGVVEGRARVVLDPDEADDFENGDILVCETTDPSWVVLFQLAAAAVIDVGGPLSHGAIVARELGLPAVINTRNGTHAIGDGDRVRVDGSTGEVTVLDPERTMHAA